MKDRVKSPLNHPNLALPFPLPIKDRYKRNSVQFPAIIENLAKKEIMILKNNKFL